MASMLMMKQMPNTILRSKLVSISKPHLFHSYSSLFSSRASRLSFTSSSKISQNPYPREDGGGEEDAKAAERIRQARQVYEEKQEDMKQSARSLNEKAKEGTREKLKEGTHRAGETMQEAKEKVREGTHRAGEKVEEAKERTKDSVEWTAEKTKEGAGKVAEAMQNVGEKAKETAKGAWETAKDATRRMKETVVGEDEDKHARPEDYIDDQIPKYGDTRDQSVRKQGKHGGPAL